MRGAHRVAIGDAALATAPVSHYACASMNPGTDSSMMSAMTIQMLAAGLFAGLALLGLGTSIGNQRANREAGLDPLALLLKGAGLLTLTLTLYRFIKSHS